MLTRRQRCYANPPSIRAHAALCPCRPRVAQPRCLLPLALPRDATPAAALIHAVYADTLLPPLLLVMLPRSAAIRRCRRCR